VTTFEATVQIPVVVEVTTTVSPEVVVADAV
jgi:hypothetical protein